MNIVWILNNYPPVVLAGAELSAHRLNKWLLSQHHSVLVYIISNETYPSEYEGVTIKPLRPFDCYSLTLESNTILVSQLWATRFARTLYDRNPHVKYIEFVHYVDNTVISPYPWTNKDFQMVYNSLDTKERALAIAPWLETKQALVVPPFLTMADVPIRTDFTKYPWITLVNVSKDKGADRFHAMALEDTKGRNYVGIKGSHGTQETMTKVELLDPTENMESIWEKTRILVVLSTYETWSMVASEAMMRGIPVLCANHIPALKENCGSDAVYVDRMNTKECLDALDLIESNYVQFSERAMIQARKHLPKLDTYLRLFS
jgi:glycosyltransferase involved in cell wall biosynthesis